MFFNVWQGGMGKIFWDYIKSEKEKTDIFCFMEAGDKFRAESRKLLSNYTQISAEKYIVDEEGMFQVTYIKNNLELLESEPVLGVDPNIGLGLFTKIKYNDKILNLINVHGVARPWEKLDNLKRLEQSRGVVDYMKDLEGMKIIGGDFNLDKNTESVKMFEKNGYRNLIEDFQIETTRNRISWEKFNRVQLWADFCFVSPDVNVKGFEVPKNEVSDHLPLVLEIEE